MANNSPTIVAASLSDDQLKKSIDSLVTHVDEAMKKMVQSTNNAVGEMEAKLKSLGNIKIDSDGSADGGASKRAKAQNAETDAIDKAITARGKQIKQNQEAAMTFDQIAAAQQKAASGGRMGIMETYNMQIELLINRLREVRQDIDIFNAAIGSGKKTQIEWGQQGLRQANAEAEKLMRTITTLENQRGNLANVLAPQGHTIQNYVNSLQKANPELAKLNDSFKRGQSLMQNGVTTTQQLANAQGELNTKTNQQKQTLDDMNAYIRQNIQRERERIEAIRQTGLAAQDAFAKIRQNAQIQLAENTDKPIKGIKELADAITNMRRLYFDMSTAERESPLGLALKRDIENAQKLKIAIDAYNRTLTGMSVFGTKNNANSSLGAYTELTNILKTLSDEYKRLGREERNAAKGNDLADKIQRLSRATQKIQQQMNRPISFTAAMKGDEKTLDDIAYKMQRLRAYKQGIDLTNPNAANEIKRVDDALAKLQKDADKWMSKSNEMIKNNTALGRSWNYMKNRLAFYFTVGASTSFIKNLIEVRSQYEMNERALGILIDSAERGTQIFNELSQMALVSPYTLIELSAAAKQLTAYDVAAKDVVDTTRRLADMAAAVGIPIERLTYALGQIKAYGYLNSRDARMFANAGIPLVKQLSDHYTELEGKLVSTADVYDRIKKKSIDYNEVMEVINKMTDKGGKFFDFQAKMADTLKVRLANLTLAWNNMLNDMGKQSQGVLTWGIGALRDLFLQWKQLNNLIENAALAVGVRTLLVALRAATIGLGSFGKAMTWNAILGKKLGGVVVGLAKSFGTLFSSRLTWFALLAIAAVEAAQALFGVNEAQKALNESIRNGAKDNYNNISKFLEQYKEVRDSLYSTKKVAIGSIYNPTTRKAEATAYAERQVGQDIDKNEAKKAWEAVREQIELTVASSDKYIGNLLSISNMSERVRQGFNLLDDIQVVNAALKEIDDDTIKVSKDISAWWNAWQAPDGLIGNLKDLVDEENELIKIYGSVEAAKKRGGKFYTDYERRELAIFRDDLQETTNSIINFIELKGWSGNESKINQVFEQITQKLVLDNQLDPQKSFRLQTEVEEARSKAAKQALLQRINDERAALKVSNDDNVREALAADIERYKNWNETNGRSKVEWERFTKWLKEQHISETTAMFRNMDAEDIMSLNFQEGKHAEWVKRMVTQYAKEHKMSYDEAFKYLKSWVRSANQWSIYIPLTISTEDKKSVYDQLGEYDKAVDEADAQIERLTKRINELNAKKEKSKEETQELANAEQELADAQKAKAKAEAKGGHGKKEKKDEKAANKAAKQAESELQKALKDELSTIDKVRSIYKDLTKEGMSHVNAVERATKGWDETVNAINRVLQKNGLLKLDLLKFAGIENPRELVNMLQSQLNTLLRRGAKPAEIKELQTKIQTLNVDADKYDLTKITKGLNNELGKLKDEYELAVELDANPELGGIFADMMGLDKEQLSQMPKGFEGVVERLQKIIDRKLGEGKFNLVENLNKASFNSWLNANKQGTPEDDALAKSLESIIDYANKVRLDSSKKQIEEWNKLLEKYAEYEYKVTQIQKEAEREREIARKKGASQEIIDAITERERQELAKLSFEEFQKTPEWIVATGDLANMSKSAIGMLIEQLEKYKRSAKNLSPKQIKQLNSALSKLYKEQRKNNPFKAISNMLDEAKERMATFDEDIEKTKKEINDLTKKKEENTIDGIVDEKTDKKLKNAIKRLQELKKNQEEVGKVSASDWVTSINETVEAVKVAVGVFDDLAKAIGGVENSDIDKVFSVLEKGGQGAAAGAQIGGGWGALIGGVAGAATGVITTFADQWSGNAGITEKVNSSERAVRRLELAFIDLQQAVEESYGAAAIGAKQATLANKELQLAEIQRQIELEKSRKSKNRDEDKIIELQTQYKELFYEIKNGYTELVDDLMGTDVSSFAENLVSSMIDAFKKGEDYMKIFNDKFDEMIDNMIMKSIVSRVVSQYLDQIWESVDEHINDRSKAERDEYAKAQNNLSRISQMNDEEIATEIARSMPGGGGLFGYFGNLVNVTQQDIEDYKKAAADEEQAAKKRLDAATAFAGSDIDYIMGEMNKVMPELGEKLKDILGEYYKFGESSETQLSALQQGIQGITEDTAGALEAYMNSVSQQVYLQSDLLTQIRDAVTSFDMDVQVASMSQILLQLQSNYIIMQSMHGMMESWTIPSGTGIRVELMS